MKIDHVRSVCKHLILGHITKALRAVMRKVYHQFRENCSVGVSIASTTNNEYMKIHGRTYFVEVTRELENEQELISKSPW